MKTITKNELDKIIADHKLWLSGNPNGARADLRGANLRNTNLDYVNLLRADFSGADLAGSSFKNAELTAVDFSYANLSDANLSHASGHLANFRRANLIRANLFLAEFEAADFSSAVLKGANLCGAQLREADLGDADLAQSCGLVYAQAAWSDHGELGSRITAAVIDGKVWYFCGGFQGTEAGLRQYIEDGAEKYRASRTKAADFVSSCIAENLK